VIQGEDVNKIALFSGRFDPIHLGHVITIGRLLEKYKKVIVCILDYPERSFLVDNNVSILKTFLRCWNDREKNRVILTVNKTHFAKITPEEIQTICWNAVNTKFEKFTYVGGNEEVNSHVKGLGVIDVEYISRSYFYNSSSIRKSILQ
jgi:cytidyltransferase-like protein